MTNPFKAAKIIDIVFFSALFIFSLFSPFDLKGKIIFSTFILIGGIVALKITKILELTFNKIKKHNEK